MHACGFVVDARKLCGETLGNLVQKFDQFRPQLVAGFHGVLSGCGVRGAAGREDQTGPDQGRQQRGGSA